MPLAVEVGLNPSDIVLDGDKAPLPQKGAEPPVFGSCLVWPNGCMDQDATAQATLCSMWTQRPLPEKRGTAPPFFGPCLLWPNGWMDQDASWYDDRPQPGQHCVRCRASSTPKGHSPQFRPMSVVAKRLDGLRYHLVRRQASPSRIVLHGDQAPPPKGAQLPQIFGPCQLWPNGRPSQLLLRKTSVSAGLQDANPTIRP